MALSVVPLEQVSQDGLLCSDVGDVCHACAESGRFPGRTSGAFRWRGSPGTQEAPWRLGEHRSPGPPASSVSSAAESGRLDARQLPGCECLRKCKWAWFCSSALLGKGKVSVTSFSQLSFPVWCGPYTVQAARTVHLRGSKGQLK